jgi:hypothetical protein
MTNITQPFPVFNEDFCIMTFIFHVITFIIGRNPQK